jgi:protein-S-isoprenylcysteine O-methyltransferase Ste14
MNLSTLFNLDVAYLIIAWFIFGALHSVLASRVVKEKTRIFLPLVLKHYRIVYNAFALITFLGVMGLSISLSGDRLLSPSVIWEFVGLMFATYGLLIMRVAMKSYGWREFLGIERRSEMELQEKTLKQTGLLNYIRHPLYTGVILIFTGMFFYMPSFIHLVNLGCVIAYVIVGVHYEEKRLIAIFGNRYKEYRSKVPALFPNLR